MKKRFGIFIAVLCMCIGLINPDVTVWAASGKTSVSVSSSNVNIGDTITVTGKATGPSGEKVLATMQLSWDANVLQFVSCSVDSNGGGGSRLINGDSFTITLKAISAGTSAVSLTASDGVLFDTVESLDSMAGSSASVTVNNAASNATGGSVSTGGSTNTGGSTSTGGDTNAGGNTSTDGETLSADNSLKSLTISPGTLSPSFSYKTTSYTATVGSDVTSIAVSATPSNAKAVVQSVTGNDNLKPGENTIQVVVKAENGVTATYTIKVTKQAGAAANAGNSESEEKPSESEMTQESIVVNSVAYEISEKFSEDDIPADFAESTINYHGNQYKGVSFSKGSLNLLWMVPQNVDEDEEKGKFFVYDETRDVVYPFVRMGSDEKYVIALLAPVDFTMPETYLQTSLAVEGDMTITAYQNSAGDESEIVSEFYVFYGVNHEGTENWYQYDALEGTYQRLAVSVADTGSSVSDEALSDLQEEYTALSKKYNEEKASLKNTIGVLIFIIAVLIIVVINLLVAKFRKHDDDDFDDDDFDDDDFDDDLSEDEPEEDKNEDVSVKEVRSESPKLEKESTPSKMKDLDIIDFNDL